MNRLILLQLCFGAVVLHAIAVAGTGVTRCFCDCVATSADSKGKPMEEKLFYCDGKPQLQPSPAQTGMLNCDLGYSVEEFSRFPLCKVCDEQSAQRCSQTKTTPESCTGWRGKMRIKAASGGTPGENAFEASFEIASAPQQASGTFKNCQLVEDPL